MFEFTSLMFVGGQFVTLYFRQATINAVNEV